MSKTSRKFLKFVLFLIVLIIFIYLWIKINKSSQWIIPLTKLIGDEDVANMIFKTGLGGLIIATFIGLVVYILRLMGIRLGRIFG